MKDHESLGGTLFNLSIAWEERETWTLLGGRGAWAGLDGSCRPWAGCLGGGRHFGAYQWIFGVWEDHEQG